MVADMAKANFPELLSPSKRPSEVQFGSIENATDPTTEIGPAKGKKTGGPSGIGTSSAKLPKLQVPHRRGRNRSRGKASSKPPQHPDLASANANPPRSWAAAVKSSEIGYALTYISPTYIPPTIVGGRPIMIVSDEILEAAHPKWKECLVGYFVGKRLRFKLVESAVKHIWGTHLSEVMVNDDGFYFFRIPDDEFRRRTLDNGPITIARVPLILQQWHPRLILKKDQHGSLPVC